MHVERHDTKEEVRDGMDDNGLQNTTSEGFSSIIVEDGLEAKLLHESDHGAEEHHAEHGHVPEEGHNISVGNTRCEP